MDKRWTAVSRFGICLVQVVIHLYIYIFLHLGPKRFRCGRNMLNSETFRINIWIFAVVHVHCLVASTNEQSRCLVVCMDETCIFTIYINIFTYMWYIYICIFDIYIHLYIPIHCKTQFLSAHQDDGGQKGRSEDRAWSKWTLDIAGKVYLQSAVDGFRL